MTVYPVETFLNIIITFIVGIWNKQNAHDSKYVILYLNVITILSYPFHTQNTEHAFSCRSAGPFSD